MDIWLLILGIISIILSIAVITLVLVKSGPQGPNGNNGSLGLMGDNGPTGNNGPLGQTGITGYNGTIIGPMGPIGPMGITGDGGGLTGIKGSQGQTGYMGQQGSMGPTITNMGPLGIYYINPSSKTTVTIGSSFQTPLYNAHYFCQHQGGTINIEYNPLYEPPIGSTFVLDMYNNYNIGSNTARYTGPVTSLYSTSVNNGSTKYRFFFSISETHEPGTNISGGLPQTLSGWNIFSFNWYTFTYIGDFIAENGTIATHTFAVSVTSMPANGGAGNSGTQTDCPP